MMVDRLLKTTPDGK